MFDDRFIAKYHQGTYDCECYHCEGVRRKFFMSPEHEKLFTLLCVVQHIVARHSIVDRGAENVEKDAVTLWARINWQCRLALAETREDAKVSLRVRGAVEEIVRVTAIHAATFTRGFGTRERVLKVAEHGLSKARLLTTVTEDTWREQCAGRAVSALAKLEAGYGLS